MKSKENSFIRYFATTFCIFALGITIYVLFQYPQPGVADQGDFDRIMSVSGLELTETDRTNPDFKRFYEYTVTDYRISESSVSQILGRLRASTMAYVITGVSFICRLLGQNTFKTGYLAAVYGIIYIFSIIMILKCINIKNNYVVTVLALLCLLIFFDGNYLLWFNSLYGEPMMITTLLLYAAAWLYYIYHQMVLKNEKKRFLRIVFIFVAAFLFIGSKMQVISSIPVIMLMLGNLLWQNRRTIKKYQLAILSLFYCILIIYPLQMNLSNGAISKDTQYNSVFYGVLKDSKTPEQDLIDLGLNPDMEVEAGKHAYLDSSEYVKYVPRTEITEKEFYSKIGNGKLAKFYLTHPIRLIQGMEYTSGKVFYTSTSLGKYKRSYSEVPIREFSRFTLWSKFRENMIPKRLIFIVVIYAAVLFASIIGYRKSTVTKEVRAKIQLLWAIMVIGALQFPMPFIGNGQADTAKQLYLFNFIFDIILIVSGVWCLNKLMTLKHRNTDKTK